METKLPYYMMYPLPNLFDEDKIERRDYEYLKSMYPEMAKIILPYVEDECERYEYEESMIYDEYPDKLQLRLMSRRIFDRVQNEEMKKAETGEWEDQWTRDIVDLLLFQELMKRRNDRRRRRKRMIW